MRTIMKILLVAFATVAASSSSHAITATLANYCDSQSYNGSLTLSGLTLQIGSTSYTPADCYGVFTPDNVAGVVTTASATGDLNNIFSPLKNSFVYLDQSGTAASPTGLGGGIVFNLSLTAATQTNDATYTITWTDNNTTTPPNFPLSVNFALDFDVTDTQGNLSDAAYTFQNVELPGNGSGTGTISFHYPLAQRPVTFNSATLAGTIVPEPASVALLAVGLLGLGLARRRR